MEKIFVIGFIRFRFGIENRIYSDSTKFPLKNLPIPISSRVAVDLGGGDGVVDRLTVRQAVGQAGGVATESQGKREVQGEPGVANLFLII